MSIGLLTFLGFLGLFYGLRLAYVYKITSEAEKFAEFEMRRMREKKYMEFISKN